jgi:hypothetical protein
MLETVLRETVIYFVTVFMAAYATGLLYSTVPHVSRYFAGENEEFYLHEAITRYEPGTFQMQSSNQHHIYDSIKHP